MRKLTFTLFLRDCFICCYFNWARAGEGVEDGGIEDLDILGGFSCHLLRLEFPRGIFMSSSEQVEELKMEEEKT